jgi:pimeloyl-ACP methyl ester carboxylesterase
MDTLKIKSEDGLELNVYRCGNGGPALHFYHANSFCACLYEPILLELAKEFTVYATDVRGHGRSQRPDRINSWYEIAADLETVLTKVIKEPVIAIGHSLGAVTTMLTAVRKPQLIRQILALDPVFFLPRHLWTLAIIRTLRLEKKFFPVKVALRRQTRFSNLETLFSAYRSKSVFQRWRDDMLKAYCQSCFLKRDDGQYELACPPNIEADIYAAIPLSTWRQLKRLQTPMTIVRGQLSDTLSARALQKAQRSSPFVKILEIPEAGHLFPMEKPELTAELIKSIIKGENPTQLLIDKFAVKS